MGGSVRKPSEKGADTPVEDDMVEGPVFIISTNDLCHVLGNTEAHYISRLFASSFETHIFAPLSGSIPNARNHRFPFGGVLGVFALNVLFLPYWIYVGLRVRPKVVYAYNNVLLPPLVVRAVSGAVVVHDLQCDPHGQLLEFAETKEPSRSVYPLLSAVRIGHRFVLPRSDAVITLSTALKELIYRKYAVAWDDIHIVPLGVDTEPFSPDVTDGENAESAESHCEQPDRIRIAYLGTIKRIRGLETVVDGLANLDDEHRQRVRFDVFGTGEEEFLTALAEKAADSGVEMVYHGHIAHSEVPAALDHCDLAVSPLPPLDAYRVSCPAKIFEYLAMGLPVVATRIPPHERHLTHGEDAMLVDPENTDEFARTVAGFLDAPELLRSASANARRTALDQDWSKRFQRISSVIASARRDGTETEFTDTCERLGDQRPTDEQPPKETGVAPNSVESRDTPRRER
jgi:glycosyltransferase involved in cell wall biosynthesis